MRALNVAALVMAGLVAGCATYRADPPAPRYYWKDGITAAERESDRAAAGLEASRADPGYDPYRDTAARAQSESAHRRANAADAYLVGRGYRRVTLEELRALEQAEREAAGGK